MQFNQFRGPVALLVALIISAVGALHVPQHGSRNIHYPAVRSVELPPQEPAIQPNTNTQAHILRPNLVTPQPKPSSLVIISPPTTNSPPTEFRATQMPVEQTQQSFINQPTIQSTESGHVLTTATTVSELFIPTTTLAPPSVQVKNSEYSSQAVNIDPPKSVGSEASSLQQYLYNKRESDDAAASFLKPEFERFLNYMTQYGPLSNANSNQKLSPVTESSVIQSIITNFEPEPKREPSSPMKQRVNINRLYPGVDTSGVPISLSEPKQDYSVQSLLSQVIPTPEQSAAWAKLLPQIAQNIFSSSSSSTKDKNDEASEALDNVAISLQNEPEKPSDQNLLSLIPPGLLESNSLWNKIIPEFARNLFSGKIDQAQPRDDRKNFAISAPFGSSEKSLLSQLVPSEVKDAMLNTLMTNMAEGIFAASKASANSAAEKIKEVITPFETQGGSDTLSSNQGSSFEPETFGSFLPPGISDVIQPMLSPEKRSSDIPMTSLNLFDGIEFQNDNEQKASNKIENLDLDCNRPLELSNVTIENASLTTNVHVKPGKNAQPETEPTYPKFSEIVQFMSLLGDYQNNVLQRVFPDPPNSP